MLMNEQYGYECSEKKTYGITTKTFMPVVGDV